VKKIYLEKKNDKNKQVHIKVAVSPGKFFKFISCMDIGKKELIKKKNNW
jgi:hypothetical protein